MILTLFFLPFLSALHCTLPLQGLGCPVGSVIVGTKELMARALRIRKVLGGGLRQVHRDPLKSPETHWNLLNPLYFLL